jgi:hypothetical protein
MSNVIEMFGVCEAEKCKRPDRKILERKDLVIVEKKKYHRGCEPTAEEQKAKTRSYT